MSSEFKACLVAIGCFVLLLLIAPWIARLIDMWVEYKNWVLGL